MSQKSGIFNFQKLCQKNLGFFLAGAVFLGPAHANILDACMIGFSCMLSTSYYSLFPDASMAMTGCANRFPNEIELLRGYGLVTAGYELGQDLRLNDVKEHWDATVRILMEVCLNYRIGTPATNSEYYLLHYEKDDAIKLLSFTATINPCPSGGKTSTEKVGIGSCYLDTFSDSTGSGVYSPVCLYTE